MKIYDLECCGCRRKYTFTVQMMQLAQVADAVKGFEEAVFGFDCPACNYRNAFQFKYLIDARLARAAKWANFICSRLECRMTIACQNPDYCCGMVSYSRYDALRRRWGKVKAFLDAVQNARLELFDV